MLYQCTDEINRLSPGYLQFPRLLRENKAPQPNLPWSEAWEMSENLGSCFSQKAQITQNKKGNEDVP